MTPTLHRPSKRPPRTARGPRALLLAAAAIAAPACSSLHRVGFDDPPGGPPMVDRTPAGPSYGSTVQQADPPPAISGGTLAVLHGGALALAADPDRDRLHVVDLVDGALSASIALQRGDEPGRVVEDAEGRAHVALRRGGAIVDVDPARGVILGRRDACPSPRGLAYDARRDLLWLACLDGELLGFPAAGGAATVRFQLATDLRDVVVQGDRLLVSRFRSAEVLTVDAATGAELERAAPVAITVIGRQAAPLQLVAAVAWRLIDGGAGGPLLVHQRAAEGEVDPSPGGYGAGGGGCSAGAVTSAITRWQVDGPRSTPILAGAPLPVDVAFDAARGRVALVAAGSTPSGGFPSVTYLDLTDALSSSACSLPPGDATQVVTPPGQATAAAFRPSGQLVIQLREPAMLVLADGPSLTTVISLDVTSRRDTGHDVFHLATGLGLACASCHPEGGDDGRVWRFARLGPRRTFALRGGVMQRTPFHWDGALAGLDDLLAEVLEGRMAGPSLRADQRAALAHFLDALPALRPPAVDAAASARGQALFASAGAGCLACHGGAQHTSGARADVGTGGTFKVSSLAGLAQRAPYLHDGAAATLRDRFTLDVDGRHRGAARLSAGELDDLVAYLGTL